MSADIWFWLVQTIHKCMGRQCHNAFPGKLLLNLLNVDELQMKFWSCQFECGSKVSWKSDATYSNFLSLRNTRGVFSDKQKNLSRKKFAIWPIWNIAYMTGGRKSIFNHKLISLLTNMENNREWKDDLDVLSYFCSL